MRVGFLSLGNKNLILKKSLKLISSYSCNHKNSNQLSNYSYNVTDWIDRLTNLHTSSILIFDFNQNHTLTIYIPRNGIDKALVFVDLLISSALL